MKSRFTPRRLESTLYALLAGIILLLPGHKGLEAQQATAAKVSTGFVSAKDGVHLYYAKVGSGPKTVIMPGRLFAFRDFQRLANGRTLIFYAMRNRGLLDAVPDKSRIGLQYDVDDLESVRAHFGVEKPD